MKKRKFGLALSLVLAAGTVLGACGKKDDNEGSSKKSAFNVAMVTDVGGVDDKSFNQSAWEGLQAFGKANGLEKGNGIDYLQSQSDADYATNLNSLVRQKNDLVFGIGFMMSGAVEEIAKQQTDAHFAIVDSVINLPNVASITFKEQESSFLAGLAAGKATKSNKIGFIGGVEGEIIDHFEAGFVDGVKAANPKAKVDVQYAGAFDKPEVGKTIASKMYASGADVVFHASGGTGAGLFTEARELKEKDPSKYIWAIGVDSDQSSEGVVGDHNVVLTSALKGVAAAVQDISTKAKEDNFPGGQSLVYGLKENGVGLSEINKEVENKAEIDALVKEWTDKIKNGEYTVPDKPAK
ncbi:BMP family lipoprotein [Niallia sp. 03133]|uniref:BMP family lipoprotein n=1 Tax=Niallia sp. 03133 TaxID=3458060 RepID=UPI004043DAB9